MSSPQNAPPAPAPASGPESPTLIRKKKASSPSIPPHGDALPPSSKSSVFRTVLKVLGLAGLIPMVLAVPYMLTFLGNAVVDRVYVLLYIWLFYSAVLLFIVLYWRRSTLTLDSFTTQNLVHLVLSIGAYHFLSIANILPVRLRQVAISCYSASNSTLGWFVRVGNSHNGCKSCCVLY